MSNPLHRLAINGMQAKPQTNFSWDDYRTAEIGTNQIMKMTKIKMVLSRHYSVFHDIIN